MASKANDFALSQTAVSGDAYAWLPAALETIKRAHWYRQPPAIDQSQGSWIEVAGQSLLNFASNDYLGLANDSRLAAAAIEATQKYGTGSTGSRLLSGHRPLHRQLEAAIATLKGTADAIVFSSGYLANMGTISALMGPRDLILADQYNHASLKQGATLSGATVVNYRHGDAVDLHHQLGSYRVTHRRCLIVTDSVFSMDGDLCPLPEILDLAQHFDAMVMVDEAHGTGVFGETGAGVVEHFGCTGQPLIQMGTLSKALGSLGGYVTGSATLIDFLRNRAASFIYTTALSPAAAAAAEVAIAILKTDPQRRQQLQDNALYLRQQLDHHLSQTSLLPKAEPQLKRLASDSPIICLQVKNAATVLAIGQHLQAAGLFVSTVRPPTVPTSRLRMTVTATHTKTQIDELVQAIQSLLSLDL